MTDKQSGSLKLQRMTRTEKPSGMMEIRLGSSSAKMYPVRNKNRVVYQVAWHVGGTRYRTSYTDKAKAIARAELAVKKLNAGEAQVLSLVNQDRQDYLAARRLLTPHQINLVHAIKDYTAALKLLKGAPLLTAVQSYAKSQGTSLTPIRAEALVQKLIQTRTDDGASERYIADLRSRLGRFGKAFQTPVSSITTQDLDDWLRGLKINPRNRRNFRTLLVALFNFAREQGYLPKHLTTAADDLPMPKVKSGPIEIYTPTEILRLLHGADEQILPFVALGAFAGLRSAEIERLDWESVKWDQGFVVVNPDAAKTSQRRLVPMLPPLRSWLKKYQGRDGKIIENIKVAYRLTETSKKSGVPWKGNALRHSFASYRLAEIQSAPQVALEMGNSPAIIFSNYRELVPREQATLWWNLSTATKLENLK
jgi:integrase